MSPPNGGSQTSALSYADSGLFQGASRTHDFLKKRLGVPPHFARRAVRALCQMRNPWELLRRPLAPVVAPAIPWQTGYRVLTPEILPGMDRVAALCADWFQAHLADTAEARRAAAKKPYLVTLAQDLDFVRMPEVLLFLLSPPMLDLMRGYFPRVPRLASVRLWWSPPNDDNLTYSQLFHVDHADDREVKLLLNVTDTESDQGPFTFLPADATETALKHVRLDDRRITDAALFAALGPAVRPIALTGPAGTAALVDTSRCLHYGSRGNQRARLMLMAQFVDFYAPRVLKPVAWSPAAERLGPLTRAQELLLGVNRRLRIAPRAPRRSADLV